MTLIRKIDQKEERLHSNRIPASMFRRNERTDLRTRLGGRECPVGEIEPESLPSWVSIDPILKSWVSSDPILNVRMLNTR